VIFECILGYFHGCEIRVRYRAHIVTDLSKPGVKMRSKMIDFRVKMVDFSVFLVFLSGF